MCVDKCPGSTEFGDPVDPYRRCVTECTGTPLSYAYSVTKLCVTTCPISYFAAFDNLGNGICVQSCQSPLFADPVTGTCRTSCKAGYFGYPVGSRPCVPVCPRYWYGMNSTTNRLCVQTCDNNYWGDVETSMCYNVKTSCSNATYADPLKFMCVAATDCTTNSFADPFTKGCESSCSNGYYADSNINTCVPECSANYSEFGQWGICRKSCILGRWADVQANRTCQRNCSRTPLALYGTTDANNYQVCV